MFIVCPPFPSFCVQPLVPCGSALVQRGFDTREQFLRLWGGGSRTAQVSACVFRYPIGNARISPYLLPRRCLPVDGHSCCHNVAFRWLKCTDRTLFFITISGLLCSVGAGRNGVSRSRKGKTCQVRASRQTPLRSFSIPLTRCESEEVHKFKEHRGIASSHTQIILSILTSISMLF